MEINSIVIGLVILLLFTVPILYVIRNSSQKNSKKKQMFMALCSKNGATITSYDTIGSAIIGLDTTNKKLAYSSVSEINNFFQVVDLTAVKSCQVKTTRTKKQYLEHVSLELNGEKLQNEIVVYNENDETLQADPNACLCELQKWERLVKQYMS